MTTPEVEFAAEREEEYDLPNKLALTNLWRVYQSQSRGQKIFAVMLLSCVPMFVPFLVQFY
jgi:hypothetical protein